MKRHTNARGFTLIEMAIVVVIIGVLAVIGTVVYTRYKQTARLSEATHMTEQIRAAQEAFFVEKGIYANVSTSINAWYPSAAPGKFATQWGADCTTCVTPDAWRQINVTPAGPVMYGYATIASLGGLSFLSPFTVNGANASIPPAPSNPIGVTKSIYATVAWGDTNADGTPSIVVSYSVSNQLFVQEE